MNGMKPPFPLTNPRFYLLLPFYILIIPFAFLILFCHALSIALVMTGETLSFLVDYANQWLGRLVKPIFDWVLKRNV